jgi:L-ascorbate metabolism protein UlaG (beta-lactamase superfamily)
VEIQYYGGNCIKIVSKKSSVVIDDNLVDLGLKQVVGEKDIALYTSTMLQPAEKAHFVIEGPGDYEVSEVSIHGVAARAHIDEEKEHTATMYRVIMDDLRIAVTGHIYPNLSEDQLEALGPIDVLIVPVGGSGYTLDGIGAQKVIKQIEPKIVVPTHYAEKGINYEVPQADLESALKSLSMEPADTVDSLKTKNLEMSDTTKLIVIQR